MDTENATLTRLESWSSKKKEAFEASYPTSSCPDEPVAAQMTQVVISEGANQNDV